jgi:hypothetical protein
MTRILITKKDTASSMLEKLKHLEIPKAKKPFNPKKYLGKVKGFGDPLQYQKNVRNEW